MGKRENVTALIEAGKTTREIAEQLEMPIATVRYYREPSKARRGQQITEHRRKVKRKAVDYSGGKCLKCGYDTCEAGLTFHHLDPNEKEHGLASGNTWGWDKTKKEVDKTILVCHNCHAEHHAGLWDPDQKMIDEQQRIRESYVDQPLSDYRIDL